MAATPLPSSAEPNQRPTFGTLATMQLTWRTMPASQGVRDRCGELEQAPAEGVYADVDHTFLGMQRARRAHHKDGWPVTLVVVIEDEADIREVIAEALVDEGYDVARAADGALGLQLVRERMPQIVILDLMMPELDGRGFLRECRADPRCASLKVIVISALRATDLNKFGVQAVITKPFDLYELINTVLSLAPI
jgi:CheY-like chemotaxis protein